MGRHGSCCDRCHHETSFACDDTEATVIGASMNFHLHVTSWKLLSGSASPRPETQWRPRQRSMVQVTVTWSSRHAELQKVQ